MLGLLDYITKTTPKAEVLRVAYDEVSEAANEIFYNGFTDDEIIFFENTLRRILRNFEEYENNDKRNLKRD